MIHSSVIERFDCISQGSLKIIVLLNLEQRILIYYPRIRRRHTVADLDNSTQNNALQKKKKQGIYRNYVYIEVAYIRSYSSCAQNLYFRLCNIRNMYVYIYIYMLKLHI